MLSARVKMLGEYTLIDTLKEAQRVLTIEARMGMFLPGILLKNSKSISVDESNLTAYAKVKKERYICLSKCYLRTTYTLGWIGKRKKCLHAHTTV